MGIGRELDRYDGLLHKPRLDYILLVVFVGLIIWTVIIGLMLLE
ncbi:MAG: hypothetical protein O2779_04685 [Nanoarchaeota archaeon]|nr:hypothetical protein [Nanoarchaeota archaeon]